MSIKKYDKSTVLALSVFLGIFGVHRFYIGKKVSGFAMVGLLMMAIISFALLMLSTVYKESFLALDNVITFNEVSLWSSLSILGIWSLFDSYRILSPDNNENGVFNLRNSTNTNSAFVTGFSVTILILLTGLFCLSAFAIAWLYSAVDL